MRRRLDHPVDFANLYLSGLIYRRLAPLFNGRCTCRLSVWFAAPIDSQSGAEEFAQGSVPTWNSVGMSSAEVSSKLDKSHSDTFSRDIESISLFLQIHFNLHAALRQEISHDHRSFRVWTRVLTALWS